MISEEQIFNFLKEKGIQSSILVASFQRKFGIEYREAARIMDRLVDEGYISEYYPKQRVRYILKI